ncbi:hypothetical protein V8E54_015124 [Elaphomyces granulatus]
MAPPRGCSLCGKPIKSLSGLGRHTPYCKARKSLSALTSEARALLEKQWSLESSQHLQNNIIPNHEAPINTSTEDRPEISDMNTLDDAYYSSLPGALSENMNLSLKPVGLDRQYETLTLSLQPVGPDR